MKAFCPHGRRWFRDCNVCDHDWRPKYMPISKGVLVIDGMTKDGSRWRGYVENDALLRVINIDEAEKVLRP